MRKPAFCICENKDADQLRGSAFVFATRILQSLYFPNTKFLVSSHFQWMCSPVCVRPGRKPRRPVFSQRGSSEPHHKKTCLWGFRQGLTQPSGTTTVNGKRLEISDLGSRGIVQSIYVAKTKALTSCAVHGYRAADHAS